MSPAAMAETACVAVKLQYGLLDKAASEGVIPTAPRPAMPPVFAMNRRRPPCTDGAADEFVLPSLGISVMTFPPFGVRATFIRVLGDWLGRYSSRQQQP
jgi:hypothetical protein